MNTKYQKTNTAKKTGSVLLALIMSFYSIYALAYDKGLRIEYNNPNNTNFAVAFFQEKSDGIFQGKCPTYQSALNKYNYSYNARGMLEFNKPSTVNIDSKIDKKVYLCAYRKAGTSNDQPQALGPVLNKASCTVTYDTTTDLGIKSKSGCD